MKLHTYRYLAVPFAAACCLTSCKDEGPKEPPVPQAPQVKPATPAERSAKLALLDLVPAESSCVYALYDIPSVVQSFMASHTGEYINSASQLKQDASPDTSEEENAVPAETEVDTTKLMAGGDNASPAAPVTVKQKVSVPVKNVVIAGGSDMPALFTKLAPVLQKVSEITQSQNINTMTDGLFSVPGKSLKMDPASIQQLVSAGLELLDKIDLESETGTAPVFIAVEMDEEAATQVKTSVAQLGMMAGMMSQGALMPSTAETGGVSFSGVKLDGPKASKMVAAALAGSGMDAATVNKIINKISTAKLHLLVGFKGNVGMAVFCSNPKQLTLPASPAESVLGKQEFAFVDGHLDSRAFCVSFATSPLLKSLMDISKAYSQGQTNGVVNALVTAQQKHGLDKAKIDQICSDIKALNASEQAMYDFCDVTQPVSFYSWWNKGLMGEIKTGTNNIYDWKHSAASMSGLLNVPDNALSMVISLAPDYQNVFMNLCGQAGEFAWNSLELLATVKTNKVKEVNECCNAVKPFVPLISSIWNASRKADAGYEPAQGIVMDFKGMLPSNKEIPESFAKNARIPRITSIARVADMSKLSSAWADVSKALEANKAILQPLTGKVDLAKPTEEKGPDGQTFYSYPIPNTGNDWMPVLAVSDSLVAASTSRNFIAPVVQASLHPDASAIVPTVYGPLGACIRMDSDPWAKFAGTWAQTMETTAPDSDIARNLRTVADVLNAISKDVKGIRYSVSQEDGKIVERFYFETTK